MVENPIIAQETGKFITLAILLISPHFKYIAFHDHNSLHMLVQVQVCTCQYRYIITYLYTLILTSTKTLYL